jgi:hypothetical protein
LHLFSGLYIGTSEKEVCDSEEDKSVSETMMLGRSAAFLLGGIFLKSCSLKGAEFVIFLSLRPSAGLMLWLLSLTRATQSRESRERSNVTHSLSR